MFSKYYLFSYYKKSHEFNKIQKLIIILVIIVKFKMKEKIIRTYRKPDLHLICPPKMLEQMSPQQYLTRNKIQHEQQSQKQQSIINAERMGVLKEFPYTFSLSKVAQLQQLHREQQKHDAIIQKQQQKTQRKFSSTYSHWSHRRHKMSAKNRKQQQKSNSNNSKKVEQLKQEVKQGIQMRTNSFFKRKTSKQHHKRLICKNSPYVKNKQDYQRILNNLKPVTGPTDSLIQQIARHNHTNKRNAQNVLQATKYSFQQKISKYSNRIGLKNNQKIFIMNSKDAHIRQVLLSRGWVECTDQSSTFFHLKWLYTDNLADYSKLQQGQFYNHFKNNQELTNKNLFRKNVYKQSQIARPNYPVTFDLEQGQGYLNFEKQYRKYQCFKILSDITEFIKENFKQYCLKVNKHKILRRFQYINLNFKQDRKKQKQFMDLMEPKILKKQIKSNEICQLRQQLYYFYILMCSFSKTESLSASQQKISKNATRTIQQSLTQKNLINTLLKYTSCLGLQKQTQQHSKIIQGKNQKLGASNFQYSDQLTQYCQTAYLSQHDHRRTTNQWYLKQRSIINKSTQQKNDKRRSIQNQTKIKILKKIFQGDKFLLVLYLSVHKKLKNQFQHNFGKQNLWIIKPAGVSRGTGIKIQKDFSKITNSKYGKIVQKYIEKPLLLQCGRKFDIRQWVLVKSFYPLEAYIFESCYCRFSASKYCSSNFQSLQIHLTNYSKQKNYFKTSTWLINPANFNPSSLTISPPTYRQNNLCSISEPVDNNKSTMLSSVMSQQQLESQINSKTYPNKWKQIKLQINQQILKSLKCCQYEIQSKNQCFEVYGFDIILDENYIPWVLEVNLSPACQRRQPFLTQYAHRMAEGVIDFVEGKQQFDGWVPLKQQDHTCVQQKYSVKDRQFYQKNKFNNEIENAVIRIQNFFRKRWKRNN